MATNWGPISASREISSRLVICKLTRYFWDELPFLWTKQKQIYKEDGVFFLVHDNGYSKLLKVHNISGPRPTKSKITLRFVSDVEPHAKQHIGIFTKDSFVLNWSEN